jgi:hypothetical protein
MVRGRHEIETFPNFSFVGSRLIFFDDAAMVCLRRTPANAGLIARDACRLMNYARFDFIEK